MAGDLLLEAVVRVLNLLLLRLGVLLALRQGGLAGVGLGDPRLRLRTQPLGPCLELPLALVEELAARRHARLLLGEVPLDPNEGLLALGQILLAPLQRRVALLQRGVAGLGPRRLLALAAIECLLGLRDLLLARGDRRRLLRQLGRHLGALLVGRRQLAELRCDVLLALGRTRLSGRELLLGLGDPPAVDLERLEALVEIALALFQRGLMRREAPGALVELGGTLGELLRRLRFVLVGRHLLAEHGPEILLAGERGGELGA